MATTKSVRPARPPRPLDQLSRSDKSQLLSLHRRHPVSLLLEEVPKPRRAVPPNAPPEWLRLNLDQRIPMYETPASADIQFSRQRLGRELYAQSGTDFDLSDPYCQTVSFEYDSLHDRHAVRLFRQRRRQRFLHQHGMITGADLEVVCTLRQFNEYRRYLRRLYIQRVNRVRSDREAATTDERNFHAADRQRRRFVELCHRNEKILAKREHHQQTLADERTNLVANQALLQAKYAATLGRFEQLQQHKRLAIRARTQRKEAASAQRRQHLLLMQKRRIILMKRKLTLESTLVRQRVRLQRLQRMRRHADAVADRCTAREMCNVERRTADALLLALDEEQFANEVRYRQRMVRERIQADENRLTRKRADLILQRYARRDRENLVRIMTEEIRRMARRDRLEQELLEANKSNGGDGREVGGNVDDALNDYGISKPSRSTSNMDDSKPSKSNRFTSLSARTITIPFEPHHLTAVGLVDSVRCFDKLTDRDIRTAVESTYDTMQELGELINSNNVIERAHVILMRICKGYTGDLPRDPAVMAYVRGKVDEMLERVQCKPVDVVAQRLTARLAEERLARAKKRKSKASMTSTPAAVPERHPCQLCLKFGHTFVINTSAYAEDIVGVRPTSQNVKMSNTGVRELVRTCLSTPEDAGDTPTIPEDMQIRPLAHLYRFQKMMICGNLQRFESVLNDQIEQRLVRIFNFAALQMLKPRPEGGRLTAAQMQQMAAVTVDSVLTLPEKDHLFAGRIRQMTQLLSGQIMCLICESMAADALARSEAEEEEE